MLTCIANLNYRAVALVVLLAAATNQTNVMADENVYAETVFSTAWVVTSQTSGSGVLIDRKRKLVVTNHHVVDGEVEASIFFPVRVHGRIVCDPSYYKDHQDELAVRGAVLATDAQRDIAIIRLESVPVDAREIDLGESARPGARVHSIGNPASSDALWVYTNGYVRANYYKQLGGNQMQVVETQSPINPGDSGGPIVNDEGQLIGIAQSYLANGNLISNGVDISEITWFASKVVDREVNDSAAATSPAEPSGSARSPFDLLAGKAEDEGPSRGADEFDQGLVGGARSSGEAARPSPSH